MESPYPKNKDPGTFKGENYCHSHCNWSPAFPLSSELFLTAVFSLHSFQNASLPTSSIEAGLPPPGKRSHSNSWKPRNPGKILMLPEEPAYRASLPPNQSSPSFHSQTYMHTNRHLTQWTWQKEIQGPPPLSC